MTLIDLTPLTRLDDRGTDPVLQFTGDYRFLSNFYESPLAMKGVLFPTVEHAFQAMKSTDPVMWRWFADCPTPGGAKSAGRRLALRDGWEDVKAFVMLECLRAKFASDPSLGMRLFETEGRWLEEGNDWGDRVWGTVDGEGLNMLGVLLMRVRAERALTDIPILVDGLP